MVGLVGFAEDPSGGPCKVPQGPCMVPLVLHPHHTGPGSGTDHMPGQQHREVFVGHRKQDACERAVVGDRTLSRSVGHKVLAVGDPAWDCMQSAADHHLDNADPHNDVEGPGTVDGENHEGLGAVGGEVVVGAQDQRVDPMFVFDRDWLKHEMVVEIGRLEVADVDVAYGRRQQVGERMMRVDGGQPLASCCAAAGVQRRKAFGGKRPDEKAAAVVVEEVVVKCRKAGFDSCWVLALAAAAPEALI